MFKIKKPGRKLLITTSAVAVLLILFATLEVTNVTNFISTSSDKVTTTGPTEEQKKEESKINADKKSELLDDKRNEQKKEPGDKPSKPDDNKPKNDITLRASQNEKNVIVHSLIHGYSSGTCSLIATNGSKQVKQSAPILYQPQESTCEGFSINKNELGSGDWNIKLTVKYKEKSVSNSISYKVE